MDKRKKSLKIPKWQSESESIYQRTDNTKEKVQKNKQRSTKNTHKTKDRVTRTSLKTGSELRCSGIVSSSCSTSCTLRVNLVTNPVISHELGKDRKVFTTREHKNIGIAWFRIILIYSRWLTEIYVDIWTRYAWFLIIKYIITYGFSSTHLISWCDMVLTKTTNVGIQRIMTKKTIHIIERWGVWTGQ